MQEGYWIIATARLAVELVKGFNLARAHLGDSDEAHCMIACVEVTRRSSSLLPNSPYVFVFSRYRTALSSPSRMPAV